MSGLAPAIRQIRKARQDVAPPESQHLDSYLEEYRDILKRIDAADEITMIAVADWIKGYIYETNQLPDPEAVRAVAARICLGRELDVDLQQ